MNEPFADSFPIQMDPKDQEQCRMAFGRGRFLVVWTHRFSSTDNDIRARFASTNGSLDPEFIVESSSFDEYTPDVAYSDVSERFLVVWTNANAGSTAAIYGELLDEDGNTVEDSFLIANNATVDDFAPRVAAVEGGFLVVFCTVSGWTPPYPDGGVMAVHVDSDGDPGSVNVIASHADPPDLYPAIASEGSDADRAMVVWQKAESRGGATPSDWNWNIYDKVVDNFGNPLGLIPDSPPLTFLNFAETNPGIAYTGDIDTGFLVVWERRESATDHDIRCAWTGRQQSDDSFLRIGDTEVLDFPALDQNPAVAWIRGKMAVCWQHLESGTGTWNIYGTTVQTSGQVDLPIRAMTSPVTGETEPAVAARPDGTMMLYAWQDSRAGNWDIYGQIYQEPVSYDFENSTSSIALGWTWFAKPPLTEPIHNAGGSLEMSETAGSQIVFGSWESPKDPLLGVQMMPEAIQRARYKLYSSVNGASCPGFRMRALSSHMLETAPGVWDPDWTNQDFSADQTMMYSTVDLFHISGREPGTSGKIYTLLYYLEQTDSWRDPDVTTYFTCDLLDLDTFDNDAGSILVGSVTIDALNRPFAGWGVRSGALSYNDQPGAGDFSAWDTAVAPIDPANYDGTGLDVSVGADIAITVASGNEWFTAAAVSPGATLTPGQYARALFTVTSTETGDPTDDFGPTVRAGFASTKFVFSVDKQLAGGSTQARFGSTPKDFEVWMIVPTEDPSTPGATEPLQLRFMSWLADSNTGWPFNRNVSGTVTCTQVLTELFSSL
jgi:hypothetical protein